MYIYIYIYSIFFPSCFKVYIYIYIYIVYNLREKKHNIYIINITYERYYLIPYNSLADVVRLLAVPNDTKSNVKLVGFRSQL